MTSITKFFKKLSLSKLNAQASEKEKEKTTSVSSLSSSQSNSEQTEQTQSSIPNLNNQSDPALCQTKANQTRFICLSS